MLQSERLEDTVLGRDHEELTGVAPVDGEPTWGGDTADGRDSFESEPKSVIRAKPVEASERVYAVDVMRGVALLGILAMNIVSFSWGDSVYMNPTLGGGFEGVNRGLWIFSHIVFDMKMMTTFSMLFGAGLVLMGDRADARGAKLVGTYYRRVLWLLVFGLLHAYFLWSGDILVAYAQCGLLLYPFRRLSSRTLIILGAILLVLMVPLVLGFREVVGFLRQNAEVVAANRAAEARAADARMPNGVAAFADSSELNPTGLEAPSADASNAAGTTTSGTVAQVAPVPSWRSKLDQVWVEKLVPKMHPDPAKEAKERDERRGLYQSRNYGGQVADRASRLWAEHTFGFLFATWWMIGGRMLLGMGLAKAGVFSASRSTKFYWIMLILGYGIGLPLLIYDTTMAIRNDFSFEWAVEGGFLYYPMAAVPMALGHVAAVMLVLKSGALRWLTDRLSAVGRMALTNYLTHSIVCTFLFYGWGLGLFGRVERWGLALIVLAIWVAQLWYSPIWLRHFRYGPAEWLWRRLTYWKPQRMRVETSPA
jgi:uncharacterized protein